jgi:hypothetical protein
MAVQQTPSACNFDVIFLIIKPGLDSKHDVKKER